MKSTFPEYYPLSKETVKEIWANGIFCYDANVLLNLFRYTPATRNKILDNIEFFIEKTKLPYQVCFEYLKNKREVETSLINSYDKIIGIIKKTINTLSSGELTGYRKHCALDIDRDIIKPFVSTSNKVIKKLTETKDKHASYVDFDAIHQKISELFEGKVTEAFSEEDLKKIYKEGKERYEKKVPPGFEDFERKKNNGENSLYGDLIIWKHLIEISRKDKKDVIFITDDRKKDWWDIYNGKITGVRPELYKEFRTQTKQQILLYSVEDFMKYAPAHSAIDVPRNVFSEIEELRKVEERRETYFESSAFHKLMEQINKPYSIGENIRKQFAINENSHSKLLDNLANRSVFVSKPMPEYFDFMERLSYLNTFNELIKKINAPQEAIWKAVKIGNNENNEPE